MRLSAATAIIFAGLVSGCSSSSSLDTIAPRPSRETTSSVVLSAAPVPVANVGARVAEVTPPQNVQSAPPQEMLAWAGPVPEPEAFAPAANTTTTTTTLAMPVPGARPVAFVAPDNPVTQAMPQGRSRIYGHRFRDAKPINFGRAKNPRKMAVHGVDVSRWQGEIDWPKLRTQGANFAFIKATDGGDHLDPMFKKNWRAAKAAGMRRGAYHFFYWCRTAGEQADWFIRNVPREPGALPPVIDVEYNGESSCKRRLSPERVREKMQVFMDKLEAHYGQRPIIYTAPDFYADNLQGAFQKYPFWLRAVAQHPSKVYPNRKWLFWQYSGSGLSHGVDGKIDLNVFHGSEDQWHDWLEARAN